MLLDDGSVLAAGQSNCPRAGSLLVTEPTPTHVLQQLEAWFAPFEVGDITMLVRSADVPVITWTTHSAGLALYWTAVVLGKSWPPAADSKLHVPPRIRARLAERHGGLTARPRGAPLAHGDAQVDEPDSGRTSEVYGPLEGQRRAE